MDVFLDGKLIIDIRIPEDEELRFHIYPRETLLQFSLEEWLRIEANARAVLANVDAVRTLVEIIVAEAAANLERARLGFENNEGG